MILLFTDFGWQGPYIGEMKVAALKQAPLATVVDLMHDAPPFSPKPSAYLLAALARQWPKDSVVVAVVDPGVGSARRALAAYAGGCWLVGPDNGLLVLAARQLGAAQWYEITSRPAELSASFHGRDLFAPVAGRLRCGKTHDLTPIEPPAIGADWPDELGEIIFADGYGNLVTGLKPEPGATLVCGGQEFGQLRTFSDAAWGQAFWYENSMGLAEITVNGGSAAAVLQLRPGERAAWKPE